MSATMYGWTGKIARVDLGRSEVTELDTWDYAEQFLGGRGIATQLYWESDASRVQAFDPDNPLILMTGVL
ncbi:MAG: aldehyde ferredoxin oxidoreductase, partial [Deltaproteobacteria bacterium]|nr:aldehyde ferredoxin oxidoreductase [Deltaproteobacteria bacterium]